MDNLREDLYQAVRRVMKDHDVKTLTAISALSWVVGKLSGKIEVAHDPVYNQPLLEEEGSEDTGELDNDVEPTGLVTRKDTIKGVECEWGWELNRPGPDCRLHVWVEGDYKGSTDTATPTSQRSVIRGILYQATKRHESTTS